MNSTQYIQHIRDLIARDALPEAIEHLRSFLEKTSTLDEILHQSGRFYAIRTQIRLGVVSHAEANLTQNQIRVGLLELIAEIETQGLRQDLRAEMEHATISIAHSKNAVVGSTVSAGGNVYIGDIYQIVQVGNLLGSDGKQTSLYAKRTTALNEYLSFECSRNSRMQLPLALPDGTPITTPLSQFRIDLPLLLTHSSPISVYAKRSETLNVEVLHDEFWVTHTLAYYFEREPQAKPLRRDFTISEELNPGSRLVVLGDPGCGKSTLLQWMTHYYASSWQNSKSQKEGSNFEKNLLPTEKWMPILILCRDFSEQPKLRRAEDLLRHQLQIKQFSDATIDLLLPCFHDLLKSGNAILLIDGLDEIPQIENRIAFCAVLDQVADHYPESPIIVTSRVTGFQFVQESLSAKFDHLLVAPLDRTAKEVFIKNWSKFVNWSIPETEALLREVCDTRELAKLTDSIFLLALVAQIKVLDLKLPDRRVDIYRRAVQLMIHRRQAFAGIPLLDNEIIPHLEYLAYSARVMGIQRFTDDEALGAFHQLREKEPSKTVLMRRPPEALIQVCVESVGILKIAGTKLDALGEEHQVYQFFHPSFQEYFAGQAIIHGRGNPDNSDLEARLRKLLGKIEVSEREVVIWGQYKISEFIAADTWQETVRLAIADLAIGEADAAIQLLLPNQDTPAVEKRPRVVFALLCLAEEPKIHPKIADVIFDAMFDHLLEYDGFNSSLNSWMDVAMATVVKSSFGSGLQARLIQGFIESTGKKRNQAGCCYVLHASSIKSLSSLNDGQQIIEYAKTGFVSPHSTIRVKTALELMNCFYLANGILGALPTHLQEEMLDLLVSALLTDEATTYATLWATMWLTGARNRTAGPKGLEKIVLINEDSSRKIEQYLRQPKLDSKLYEYGCLILTREKGVKTVIHQQDWIFLLANVADGAFPRRDLATIDIVGARQETIHWLQRLLQGDLPPETTCRIAQALGAFGVFVPSMVVPLTYMFTTNQKYSTDERDEALIYLAMIGNPEAANVIIAAADTPPTEDDDYSYSRGLFGLLLMDDLDLLAIQIQKALSFSDLKAYALGLAGSQDSRGVELLEAMQDSDNPNIKMAVTRALAKSWTSPIGTPLVKEVFDDEMIEQIDPAKTVCILLVQGEKPDGGAIFSYVAVRADKVDEFMAAQKSGVFYPEDFGVIIESGEGQPSPEIRKKMEDEYGFDHTKMIFL